MTLRALLLLVGALLSTPVLAGNFSFPQVGMSVTTPTGFSLVLGNDLLSLYPITRAPQFVLANADRTVTVSFDLKNHNISELSAAQLLPIFERVFEKRVPGLVWKVRKLLEQDRQQVLHLEFLSKDGARTYYNMMRVAAVNDQMQVFNLGCLDSEFGANEATLRDIVNSVNLRAFSASTVGR